MIRVATVSVDLTSENVPASALDYTLFKFCFVNEKREKQFVTMREILALEKNLTFDIAGEMHSDDDSDMLNFDVGLSTVCFPENGRTVVYWFNSNREGRLFCENFRDAFDDADWKKYEKDWED